MYNLIHAELHQIRRSFLFWISVAAAFLIGIWSGHVSSSISYGEEFRGSFEAIYQIPLIVVLSIFSVFSIGREYKGGAIRNKIIAGNTRSGIFLSRILVSFLVSLIFTTAFFIAYLMQTCSVFSPHLTLPIALKAVLSLYLVNGVWMILFSTVSLLISRQEVSILVSLALILVIAFSSSGIDSRLVQPKEIANNVMVEMTPQEIKQYKDGSFSGFVHAYTDAEGVTTYHKRQQQGTIPNPRCPVGAKRAAMEIAERTLPYGQVLLYVDYLNGCLWSDAPETIPTEEVRWLPLYSVALMSLLAVGGILAFRKKEFK